MDINKKVKLLDFKLSKNLGSNLFGIYKTNFHGKGMEFTEHKEYSYGDSTKDIDWKVSAKTQNIYTKKYEEERDLDVLFLIDISNSMNFGSKENSKKDIQEEILYSLALSAIQNNDSIGAFIYDTEKLDFIKQSKSLSNIFIILESMDKNRLNYKEKKDTSKLLEHINNINISRKLIFILTDDTNFSDQKILKIIGSKNEVILINIFDYFENNLLDENINVTLNYGNNFLNIDLNNRKKIEEYIKIRKEKLYNLEKTLRKSNIGYINIDSSKNLYKEIASHFSKIN